MDTFTLPSASNIISGISAYSADFFTEYAPLVFITLAFLAASAGLIWFEMQGNQFMRNTFQTHKNWKKNTRWMRSRKSSINADKMRDPYNWGVH